MKTTILAAATALTLVVGFAQAFATERNGAQSQTQSSNVYDRCASILANPEGYAAADVKYCRSI
jgi:hypothetical protein